MTAEHKFRRYIRLTELIPSVLDMVDSGKIAFRPAVELSYLSKEQQQSLYDTMECEDCTPSLAQAIKMKEFSRDGKLTGGSHPLHYAGGKTEPARAVQNAERAYQQVFCSGDARTEN